MTKWPLKTVTHYAEQPGDLAIHRIGNLGTVGIVTKSGTVEIEMSIEAACSLREFLVDAVCPKCLGEARATPPQVTRATLSPEQGEAGRGDTTDTNDATGAHQ